MGELRERGITFEHYDQGTPTDESGMFVTHSFRAAWVRDPDGNTLAFTELLEVRDEKAPSSSPVVHVEVRGADPDALREFYRGLALWEFDHETDGADVVAAVSEPGRYGFVERPPTADGSGVPAGVGGGPGHAPYAIFYVGVPDVPAALARAEELGGAVVMGPEHARGRDLVVAHVRDPEGNLVGLAGPAA
jgi:predicted enzyme related to lactoylglutathione lyase